MFLKSFNNGYALLTESFNDGMESEDDDIIIIEDCTGLEDALYDAVDEVTLFITNKPMDRGEKVSRYEQALIGAIEKMFPDNKWWDVTDCNIYAELMTQEPDEVVELIMRGLKRGFCD